MKEIMKKVPSLYIFIKIEGSKGRLVVEMLFFGGVFFIDIGIGI